jgi:GNAT superfamily N-acetyltransferase
LRSRKKWFVPIRVFCNFQEIPPSIALALRKHVPSNLSPMAYQIIDASPLDAVAKPLLDELLIEYSTRYKEFRVDSVAAAAAELERYPSELFAPPVGAFVLVLKDGETVGGGGFKRYDKRTAEFKRIWTHSSLRRKGVARLVVEALEDRARQQGYSRVYLTTGFKQPEATKLYLRTDYTPLFDPTVSPEVYLQLRFAKDLVVAGRTTEFDDLRYPDPLPADWTERAFGAHRAEANEDAANSVATAAT